MGTQISLDTKVERATLFNVFQVRPELKHALKRFAAELEIPKESYRLLGTQLQLNDSNYAKRVSAYLANKQMQFTHIEFITSSLLPSIEPISMQDVLAKSPSAKFFYHTPMGKKN